MCNKEKIGRGNFQLVGVIGLEPVPEPEWQGKSGYTALNSSTFFENKINLHQSVTFDDGYTKQDEFDLNNWLKSTFSSEDHVKGFLKQLSPKEYEQLVGFYLTSKDGEGKGPKSKHVLGSYNIDDLMELLNSLGSIQKQPKFKKEVMTIRMKLAKNIKNAVDGQKFRESIVGETYQKYFRSGDYQQLIFVENGLEYIYDERLDEGITKWSTHKPGNNNDYKWESDGGKPTRNVLNQFEEIKQYYKWNSPYKKWEIK